MQENYPRKLALVSLAVVLFMAALGSMDVWLLSHLDLRRPTRNVRYEEELAKRGVNTLEDGLHFTVPESLPVAMSIGDTIRYQLDDPFAAEEFARLLPRDGHVVYVRDNSEQSRSGEDDVGQRAPRVFTVALFHQLKCLDIIRRELTDSSLQQPTLLAAHCMNYLRQLILCRANTGLESVKHPLGAVDRTYDAVCKDWEAVYKEAERNQHAYTAWRNDTASSLP